MITLGSKIIFLLHLLSIASQPPSSRPQGDHVLPQPSSLLKTSSPHPSISSEGYLLEKQENSNNQLEMNRQDIPGVGLSIIFIFGSLLYGAILKAISRQISIPYNPLLLISGIILGLYQSCLGILGQSISLISSASPCGILAIFLPVLIFESSFKPEWHIFKKLAAQSLILGILSTIVSATLIMLLIKLYLDNENKFYDWDEAFVLGSILSCTDILSFVNRLKRVETPQKLTSLLEGESLFNYCTCVLIAELMQYYKEVGELAGFWEYFNLFLIEIGGGVLVGVAFGLLSVYCIKRIIYDGVLVVTLMVIFTYSIYLFAEFSTFRISGITSVTVFALYMNAFGKTWLLGETEEYVSSFWSYLVFVGETSIFIIAGVMVGSSLLHLSFKVDEVNIYNEIFSSIYIYLYAVIARFLSISVFIKYLPKFGEGLNWKETILMTVAGLKGAIGIALAMQIYKSKDFGQIASYLVMIHVTANSLITLIIHGTTTGLVVKILRLSSLRQVEYKFFKEYLFSFKANVIERMDLMKNQTAEDTTISWDEVQSQVGLAAYQAMAKNTDEIIKNSKFNDQSKFEKSLMFRLQNSIKEHYSDQSSCFWHSQKNAIFDLEAEYRKRFIKDLISKYWAFQENNETSPAALMLLIQSAHYDLDREAEEIQSWSWIKNEISFKIKLYSELMKATLVNQLAKSSLFHYISYCYDVVSSYIKANEEVRAQLLIFYQKSEHKNEDEEGQVLLSILNESDENQKQAEFFLANYLQPSFPEIEREVKTRKVSFFILHSFKNIIDRNNENGQLEPNEFDMLNHIIDSRSLQLNLASPKWEQSDLFQILSVSTAKNVFRLIPPPSLRLIASELGEPSTFDANQVIIESNEIAKYVFFVKKGGCIAEFINESIAYKQSMLAGQMFGFESLLSSIYHSKVTSNTMTEIWKVKKALMVKLFESFPLIEEAFWKTHVFQCYKMFLRKQDISYRISHIPKQKIEDMIGSFRLQRIENQTIDNPEYDMIFIRGNIDVTSKQDRILAFGSPYLKKMSWGKDSASNCVEAVCPFFFASRLTDISIRIKQPSLFLVGEFDYQIFELQSIGLSRSTLSKKTKKEVSPT